MFSLCAPQKMSKDSDVLLVCSFNQEGVFFCSAPCGRSSGSIIPRTDSQVIEKMEL